MHRARHKYFASHPSSINLPRTWSRMFLLGATVNSLANDVKDDPTDNCDKGVTRKQPLRAIIIASQSETRKPRKA
jgi:hypothetical protein